ncbi:MAG TPA: AraC family transcriptional regulator [Blastocatellia bacterium]|nr:AraC family transcriptional regulator [Blastocatellia bacterium]HMV85387.1 AraC family transcriptional regulator [Blastocatellia bacterium]HMX28643.1 AraC family transcriptional regulator [Blastocatellia bacterium]HMY75073.1 AraC family transcriptional regulator [Blastocatellia bacterium]HMZ22658.1 AraC family transcriptional regulator [Blastocatellia bacterium]
MRYQEFSVAPPLTCYVECIWSLESDAELNGLNASAPVVPERLLPDGCIELILNFGARFQEHTETGHCELQPRRFVVGQMTHPVLVSPTGAVQLLGIRFAPGGPLPFFSCPPEELTNRIVSLEDAAAALDRELSQHPYDARGLPEKIRRIQSVLLNRLRACQEQGASLQRAIAQIVHSGGQTSVDALANDLGLSGRQLERRFLREVGLGPKLLCRILRFQQVFRAVERADGKWAQVAADCGYYDQAHLIRDFRQFAGQTPAALFAPLPRFTEVFTRKQRMSDFSNTDR